MRSRGSFYAHEIVTARPPGATAMLHYSSAHLAGGRKMTFYLVMPRTSRELSADVPVSSIQECFNLASCVCLNHLICLLSRDGCVCREYSDPTIDRHWNRMGLEERLKTVFHVHCLWKSVVVAGGRFADCRQLPLPSPRAPSSFVYLYRRSEA